MEIINLMPGPVNIFDAAKVAFNETLINHRMPLFNRQFDQLEDNLKKLTRANGVIITTGSGTLANFMMLSHLKTLSGRGLIISNGEFGDRLIEVGRNLGLDFNELRYAKYKQIDSSQVRTYVESSNVAWIVLCYVETSSGISNKRCIDDLQENGYNIPLCVDCISAVGNEEIDMSKFFLATGSSGKGLGSYAGLALLFYGNTILGANVPKGKYTDLLTYIDNSVPYTLNCNLVLALKASVEEILKDEDYHYDAVSEKGFEIRNKLFENNISHRDRAVPYIINVGTESGGVLLADRGVYTNYMSVYLRREKIIQFCCMGDVAKINVENLFKIIENEKSAFVLWGA